MSMLGQCLDILCLTSSDLEEDQNSVIAHSARLWKKCKNPAESVVAVMHEVYSRIDYAVKLFDFDVAGSYDGWYKVEEALKLLSPVIRRTRIIDNKEILRMAKLDVNIPYELRKEDKKICDYVKKSTKWTTPFRKSLEAIGANDIARNVEIYDLEDMIEALRMPDGNSDYGPPNFALPWKDKYCVPGEGASPADRASSKPSDEDKVIHLQPSDEERELLALLYSRALDYLQCVEATNPVITDYSPEHNAIRVKQIDSCLRQMLLDEYL